MLCSKVGVRWGNLLYMLERQNSQKNQRANFLDGPKKDWKLFISTVKAIIKFIMDTERLANNIESKTEGLVDEQKREMD